MSSNRRLTRWANFFVVKVVTNSLLQGSLSLQALAVELAEVVAGISVEFLPDPGVEPDDRQGAIWACVVLLCKRCSAFTPCRESIFPHAYPFHFFCNLVQVHNNPPTPADRRKCSFWFSYFVFFVVPTGGRSLWGAPLLLFPFFSGCCKERACVIQVRVPRILCNDQHSLSFKGLDKGCDLFAIAVAHLFRDGREGGTANTLRATVREEQVLSRLDFPTEIGRAED